jgi:cytochrome c2
MGLVLAGGTPALGQEPGSGAALFQAKCAACHSLGAERLAGPGLGGVTERRTREWLSAWLQAPDRVLAGGDSTAQALLREYNGLAMPNQGLTVADVNALLAYLGAAGDTSRAVAPVMEPSEQAVLLGQALFQGTASLQGGGPACNSCHEVTNDAVIGGGVLARDLTVVFSRLGGPAVQAILGSPPFPVMQRAYAGRPLTESEIAALVAFLQRADAEQSLHQPRAYAVRMLLAGVVGAGLLQVLYSLAWRRRRRGSVNQSIYDRQARST